MSVRLRTRLAAGAAALWLAAAGAAYFGGTVWAWLTR